MEIETAEELIKACEEKLQGGCTTCICLPETKTVCYYIHKIGVLAEAGSDRTAQKYLIGLLSHSHEGFQFAALTHLLRIDDLESGDRIILNNFKQKRKNISLLQKAYASIRERREQETPN